MATKKKNTKKKRPRKKKVLPKKRGPLTKEHREKLSADAKKSRWHWVIDLRAWNGKLCKFETKDGFRREGRISNIEFQNILIQVDKGNDRRVLLPKMLELNNDPTDRIEFHRIDSFVLIKEE